MSIKVMSLVWDLDLSTSRKMVLLKMADHANDQGENAYPSVASVAAKCGLSKRRVQTILGDFVKQGALTITKYENAGRGQTRVYRVMVDVLAAIYPLVETEKGEAIAPFSGEKGEQVAPFSAEKGEAIAPFSGEKGATEDIKGATEDIKGAKALHPNHTNHQEPSRARGEPAPAGVAAPGGATPANAHWNSFKKTFQQVFGETDFNNYIEAATPVADDGETLLVAVPSKFYISMFEERFRTTLEHHLGRRLIVEQRTFASAAYKSRLAEREKARDLAETLGGTPPEEISPDHLA